MFLPDLILAGRAFHLLRHALVPAALCVCAAAPAVAKDQVPDWVRQAARQPLRSYPPRTDAVVLLDDHTYTISPDGTRVDHVRRVVKVLRPQGRKYATLAARFSNTQKLHYMHIWSMGADGHEYAPKDNQLSEMSDWGGFELYSDDRARVGTPPAIDTGSIAAVEYEREERPYENEIILDPEEEIPVLKETLQSACRPGTSLHLHGRESRPASPLTWRTAARCGRRRICRACATKTFVWHRLRSARRPGWTSSTSAQMPRGTRPCVTTGKTLACGLLPWRTTVTSLTRTSPQRRRSWSPARRSSATA